jgi:hypothetical protein
LFSTSNQLSTALFQILLSEAGFAMKVKAKILDFRQFSRETSGCPKEAMSDFVEFA